ncbi:MAG: hypothetical protein DKT66_10970 [Candidatus Melainabacteria bacterium]|nr:MAG: hypothetical protein DKT66_10970 [Candidatus Melainabacteria bacterium]
MKNLSMSTKTHSISRAPFLSLVLCFYASSACLAQGLTMDEMIRMTGSNSPHLHALQSSNSAQGFRNQGYGQVPQSAYSANRGMQYAYDLNSASSARASSGAYGESGNSTANGYYYAQQDSDQYDYQGTTSNQSPISRGGLPAATTAVQSLEGSFGKRFGTTEIKSANFTYGFSKGTKRAYRGVSGNRAMRGVALPPVSTASVDINTVDR